MGPTMSSRAILCHHHPVGYPSSPLVRTPPQEWSTNTIFNPPVPKTSRNLKSPDQIVDSVTRHSSFNARSRPSLASLSIQRAKSRIFAANNSKRGKAQHLLRVVTEPLVDVDIQSVGVARGGSPSCFGNEAATDPIEGLHESKNSRKGHRAQYLITRAYGGSEIEDAEAIRSGMRSPSNQPFVDAVVYSSSKCLEARLAVAKRVVGRWDRETQGGAATDSGIARNTDIGECSRNHPSGNDAQKRRRRSEDGNDENRDERDRKRSRENNERAGSGDETKRFACPYFKRNPRKYYKEPTCLGPGWLEIHRVKYDEYQTAPLRYSHWLTMKTGDIFIDATRCHRSVLDVGRSSRARVSAMLICNATPLARTGTTTHSSTAFPRRKRSSWEAGRRRTRTWPTKTNGRRSTPFCFPRTTWIPCQAPVSCEHAYMRIGRSIRLDLLTPGNRLWWYNCSRPGQPRVQPGLCGPFCRLRPPGVPRPRPARARNDFPDGVPGCRGDGPVTGPGDRAGAPAQAHQPLRALTTRKGSRPRLGGRRHRRGDETAAPIVGWTGGSSRPTDDGPKPGTLTPSTR